MFESIKKPENTFYKVPKGHIEELEDELNIQIPIQLKEFYNTIGYGFLASPNGNFNRIMDPLSVRDFRLRQNDFEFYPDIDIYDEFEDNKLIFFEGNEATMLSISFGKSDLGSIYYYDVKVAASLSEFLKKISKDDTFYYGAL